MDALDGHGPRPTAIARMPLAESVQWLLRWACDPERFTFATMVRLVAEALLQHGGSGRRSFEKNIADERIEVSVAAAFGKLGRMPTAVSQAFLEETTAALLEVVPPARRRPPRAWALCPRSSSTARRSSVSRSDSSRCARWPAV
jgi:hypothetical protein